MPAVSRTLNKHSVSRVKAVATSAVREAENGDRLALHISQRYGIGLTIIGPVLASLARPFGSREPLNGTGVYFRFLQLA